MEKNLANCNCLGGNVGILRSGGLRNRCTGVKNSLDLFGSAPVPAS